MNVGSLEAPTTGASSSSTVPAARSLPFGVAPKRGRPSSAPRVANLVMTTPRVIGSVGGAAGYVFCCGDEMLPEFLRLGLFGAPLSELGQMKARVDASTQLFLFNVDKLLLIGRFVADGAP